MTATKPCPLDACKVCTGCAHQGSRPCAGTVRCPTTGEVFTCRYARAGLRSYEMPDGAA